MRTGQRKLCSVEVVIYFQLKSNFHLPKGLVAALWPEFRLSSVLL